MKSRDNSTGIAIRLRAGRSSGVRFPTGAGNFSLHHLVQNSSGATQPPIEWVRGAVYLGVKLTTHLHLVPRSRIRGAIPPLPQYVFMAWWLVKHSDNFNFYLKRLITSTTVEILTEE
jgi:hypothetical protein